MPNLRHKTVAQEGRRQGTYKGTYKDTYRNTDLRHKTVAQDHIHGAQRPVRPRDTRTLLHVPLNLPYGQTLITFDRHGYRGALPCSRSALPCCLLGKDLEEWRKLVGTLVVEEINARQEVAAPVRHLFRV
jgi:hypothetical protein